MRLAILLIIISVFACKTEDKEVILSKPLKVSDNEIVNYIPYCNDRFNACFDYPSNFGAQPEPADGDGRSFINKIDSAEITMYGFLDHENGGLANQIDLLKEFMDIETLTEIQSGIEVSGVEIESGKIHKERILIKPDTTSGITLANGEPVNIIYSLQFVYPKSKDKKYQFYWQKMTEKFR